jgi:hypothetical protein
MTKDPKDSGQSNGDAKPPVSRPTRNWDQPAGVFVIYGDHLITGPDGAAVDEVINAMKRGDVRSRKRDFLDGPVFPLRWRPRRSSHLVT